MFFIEVSLIDNLTLVSHVQHTRSTATHIIKIITPSSVVSIC